ncbi:MAG: hypothetical protein RLZZ133_629 [Pseudomonadota bacterium]
MPLFIPQSWPRRAALLVLVIALVAGITQWMRPPVVQTTTVVSVFPSQALSVLNASGYVVAQRKAAVSTKASGRLEWLGVAEGSTVRQGDVIARIESTELQAQLNQAKAQVGLAQAELSDAQRAFERSTSLLAKNYISKASHDSTLARLEKAAASVNAARAAQQVSQAALLQAEIRAPFDGVVLTKNANVGDNITPFSSAADTKGAVVVMADMSTLEVEADVSESSTAKIVVGQPVEIGLDAVPNERFPGKVARMVPTIDRAKATRLVKLQFDQIDPRVLPDMSAKVTFLQRPLKPDERLPQIMINRAAVVEQDGQWRAFRVVDNRLEAIDLGLIEEPKADLVAAPMLKVGEIVVLRPSAGLRSGQSVRRVTGS